MNLHDVCSGLDAYRAEAVGTASSLDSTKGNRHTAGHTPVIYPPTPASAETLRQLTAAAERCEKDRA